MVPGVPWAITSTPVRGPPGALTTARPRRPRPRRGPARPPAPGWPGPSRAAPRGPGLKPGRGGVRVGRRPVAQVEHVAGRGPGPFEDVPGLFGHDVPVRQAQRRVEVALDRGTGPPPSTGPAARD